MSTPTRLDNGVTTVKKTDVLGMFKMPDPTQYHTWFDDFDKYTAADWVITTTEAGTGSATEALTIADGGALLITNAAGDDDLDFLQWAGNSGSVYESFLFESGKKLFFKAKFQISDATQSDCVMGLQITDTTPLAVTDGVYFIKADGSTTLNMVVIKDSTSTTTAVATMADATDITVAFYYDGKSEVKAYADGVHVGTSVDTNLPDDEELAVSFGIQNGTDAAKSMTVDYIFAAKER
jgi:hypothetical protein